MPFSSKQKQREYYKSWLKAKKEKLGLVRRYHTFNCEKCGTQTTRLIHSVIPKYCSERCQRLAAGIRYKRKLRDKIFEGLIPQ